ncbi:MAG TPA: radical SAM protein [bacterium]|nr:radical SAM protein [bacterium]
MKVVFLQDNGINESLSLTDVSGLLKQQGHDCELFFKKNERDFFEKVRKADPGLIVMPMDIWGEKLAIDTAEEVKKTVNAPIVFCGTYPLLFPEAIEEPGVDLVCMGEAEYPILELAGRIEAGKDYSDIPNLVLKRDGEIIRNDMRELLQDLDALPLPDREIYYKYGFMRQMSVKRFTSGRGCPNACSFCYNAVFRKTYRGKGNYVRRKSVDRMIEEIEEMQRIAPIGSIHFSDDLFTDDHPWVVEFCEKYAERFNFPWTCNTAVHAVDDEMLSAMKKAKCHGIAMGVETGREYLRMVHLNKPYRDREIVRVSELIKKHGLFFTSFNMLALPNESIEDAFVTLRLNRFIRANNVRIFFLSPIPRTRLTERAIERGELDVNYEKDGARLLTPEIKSKHSRMFENLYYMYDIGIVSPAFEWLVKKLLNIRIPLPIRILLLLPRMYREKKFFNIKLSSGIKYFLNTTLPQNRTKNFNNYLP